MTQIHQTFQRPTCRKSRPRRDIDQNVVIQIPDRCLLRAGVTDHQLWVAIALKVSYCSYSCPSRGARCGSGSGRGNCRCVWRGTRRRSRLGSRRRCTSSRARCRCGRWRRCGRRCMCGRWRRCGGRRMCGSCRRCRCRRMHGRRCRCRCRRMHGSCRRCCRRRMCGRRRRCWRRTRHRDRTYHTAARPVRGAVIIKRPGSVKGVIESRTLVENSRVPDSIGHPGGSRSRTVTGRAPSPVHCIARVNRHRRRREAETIVPNCDCHSGGACHTRVETQKSGGDYHHYRNA